MLPWKLRKCQILPVNQNLSSVYFSCAKFQLVSCDPSLAIIWQMTYTHKLPKLCSATLSNDPGKKGSNFFCCGVIRFPHIEMFSFLRRECIKLQKGSLRKKMYLNSTFKECIFVLKHFDQSQELQTIAKKCLQFYMIRTYDFCVT